MVTFAGYPVSRLVGPDGDALPAGKFGKTRNVARDDWDWIYSTYRDAPYLDPRNPLLFAANSESEGDAVARDLKSTRHGPGTDRPAHREPARHRTGRMTDAGG